MRMLTVLISTGVLTSRLPQATRQSLGTFWGESMRRVALAALLSCAAVFSTSTAHAADVTGVAFVHGTGKQTNAYQDYWQPTMVNNVRGGLANPANYVVINCDFTQYMWDSRAAGCLAGQLSSFIQSKSITRLIIITHSNGGNVMRWILSNPTYDSRYPNIINKIVRVDALAPSSAGTPLADAVINGNVFETSLGWLLGYKSDAVRQQQVSWMATYNANNLYARRGDHRCRNCSAPWWAPMWKPPCGTAIVIAVAMPKTWVWKRRNGGWTVVPMASSIAAVNRRPVRSGSRTRQKWQAKSHSAITRVGVPALASTPSFAMT